MILTQFTNPEETITGKSGIKLKCKGVDTKLEQFVLNPKQMFASLPPSSQTPERAELANIEHFSRMFRCVVKGMEGVAIVVNGEERDINTILEFDENGIMTEQSYTIAMRVLNEDPSVIEAIAGFYVKSTDFSKYVVTLKKKST